jgi:hypothetical protein
LAAIAASETVTFWPASHEAFVNGF